MFKYKIKPDLTEETKELISTFFLFKIVSIIELLGFSFIISLIIITFMTPKPNVLVVFIPTFVLLSIAYIFLEKTNPNKKKQYKKRG